MVRQEKVDMKKFYQQKKDSQPISEVQAFLLEEYQEFACSNGTPKKLEEEDEVASVINIQNIDNNGAATKKNSYFI